MRLNERSIKNYYYVYDLVQTKDEHHKARAEMNFRFDVSVRGDMNQSQGQGESCWNWHKKLFCLDTNALVRVRTNQEVKKYEDEYLEHKRKPYIATGEVCFGQQQLIWGNDCFKKGHCDMIMPLLEHVGSKGIELVRETRTKARDNPSTLNLRIPSGNEVGANDFFTPGGFTADGTIEAVIDQIPKGKYTYLVIN